MLMSSYSGHTNVDTKLKGDIAEQAAVLHALKRGWGVLKPVGDRLPYDLVFDVAGTLIKVQVKFAWFNELSGNYVVDNRRLKTNRRIMLRAAYSQSDFDFALVYIGIDLFYVFPVDVFIGYGSEIHLVEAEKRQRKPRSTKYRDAWELILRLAVPEEICVGTSVRFGEADSSRVIPSRTPMTKLLVEKSVEA
jgi:hypothetical protein